MLSAVRWTRGDAIRQGELARALGESPRLVRDGAQRRIWQLSGPNGRWLLKQFRASARRGEGLKARVGRAAADREWQALSALHGAGLPVPAPLALGALADGDRLLAMEWIDGVPLLEALQGPRAARRGLLRSLGELVARLHRAGWVHCDLHAGNVLVAAHGPVLLDWQRARRTSARAARRRDLAFLEHSLACVTSRSDRLRVRHARLGVAPPLAEDARHELRAAGDAADRRAREHARSRTRDALRDDRLRARVRLGDARGMRLRELEPETLAALVDQHREALGARDARLLDLDARSALSAVAAGRRHAVVKETRWRGLGHALGDALRGSPGRRAWLAGHGLLARRIAAARPLAYLERRRLGLPVASWVVLEDLRPAVPAAFAAESGEAASEAVLAALARLAIDLHRARVDHGDLKATNVLLRRAAGGLEPALVDLEAVRFPRRLSDTRRIAALAALNASLSDAHPAATRRRAFELYAFALPFAKGRERALAEVIERSLARRHRWTGAGCARAR